MLVVVVSLTVEIAYYIEHDPLVCYHPVTEVAGYIIVFRFWRIPRVCNSEYPTMCRDTDNTLSQMLCVFDLFFAFYTPPHKKVAGYYVIPSEV